MFFREDRGSENREIGDKMSETEQGKTPSVSVVMVSFFTGPILEEAITAVLAQGDDVELVLVNNGNEPVVEESLNARFAEHTHVRLLTGQGNIGFSRACNLGARMAQGTRLLFLDPDCVLPPDTVKKLLSHETQVKRPFLFGARLQDERGKDHAYARQILPTPRTMLVSFFHLSHLFPKVRLNYRQVPIPAEREVVPAISSSFMYIYRDDYTRMGGLDEGYFLFGSALDFCIKFQRRNGKTYFLPDIVVKHIGSTSAVHSRFVARKKVLGMVRYYHEAFGMLYPQPLLWTVDALLWMKFLVRDVLLSRFKETDAYHKFAATRQYAMVKTIVDKGVKQASSGLIQAQEAAYSQMEKRRIQKGGK